MDYDEKISQINTLINCIDEIYTNICRTDYADAYRELSNRVTDIATVMTEFMEKTEMLKKYEIDIPGEVLLTQLKNLLDAYENKDYVILADTLHYEIMDSLNVYLQIIQEFQKENIPI